MAPRSLGAAGGGEMSFFDIAERTGEQATEFYCSSVYS